MPRHVVVLGGGAAGWLTASVLLRTLNARRPGSTEITLVESGDDGTSGLGEATLPGARALFRALGFDERDLVRAADGTFRHGTRFVGWSDAVRGADPGVHYGLFDEREPCSAVDVGRLWLADRSLSTFDTYACATGIQTSLCDHMLGPRLPCSRPYEAPVDYGYQLDSGGLTRFLRDHAIGRGVRYVEDVAIAADKDVDGDLCALLTRSGQRVPGDFFVDCSGSRRMLIGGALAQPFIASREALPCDRAIAVEVQSPLNVPIPPYTLATAHAGGWTYEIALARSRAWTYYYSSSFVSDEQAERELRTLSGAGAGGSSVRRTVRTSGRHRCLWVRNCVAIGDAGGSVEPLACEGLDLAIAGLRELARRSMRDLDDPAVAGRYNERMGALYDEALDLASLHYSLSRRDDTPFWRGCRRELGIPPRVRVAASLQADAGLVARTQEARASLFGREAYRHLLDGMGRLAVAIPANEAPVDRELARSIFCSIEKRRRQAIAAAPDHTSFVAQLRRSAQAPAPAQRVRARARSRGG
jgi:flavin-dependent dehydrogenase